MKHVRRLILAALILLLVCALPEAYASIEEYAVEATLGQSVTASPVDWWSNSAFFSFTAPEEGLYMLSLTKGAQGNTYYLDQRDEDGGWIGGSLSSISDSDTAFRWVFCADADTVYYFRTYNYSGEVPAFYELTVSAPASDLFEARAKQETVYTDYGEPAVLKVFASAPAGTEVTYQWYRVENGEQTELEGATGNAYSIASVQQNETYRCTVTCSSGSTKYVYLYSKIDTHFSMEEASDRWPTVAPGEAVTLRVRASVTYGGITYEWRDNSGTIPDQTASSCTVTPTAENREFICAATDANGTRKEMSFYVSIDNQLFVRAAEKTYFSILPGETAALRVIAGCRVGDVHYQWSKCTECTYSMYGVSYDNQQDIEGATADTLTVTEPGYYWCTVTDDYGGQMVESFTVRIENGFVAWIENEEDENGQIPVEYDGSLTMKVSALCNSGTITYRWFYDNPDTYTGELIEGAASSSYHVDHVIRNERYSCLTTDQYGNSSSIFFNLDVGLEGTLVVQYASNSYFTMGINDTATMAVRAYSLAENATISYQWYYQDKEYDLHRVESDGNGPSYTIDVNSVGYEFYCDVSDSNGNRVAKWFYPALDTPLTASQNCYEAHALYGESVELSVEAETDYGPLTYQWCVESADTQWERVPIEGATAASYTVTPTEFKDIDYVCEIMDRYRKIAKYFFVNLSEPQLSAKGGQFVSFQEGDEVTLQVEVAGAMGNLSYRWSLPEEDRELEGETTDTLVVTPPAGMTVYRCVLRDDAFGPYAEPSTLDFVCTSAAWPELSLGETVTVENSGKTLGYTFTPTVGGMYHVELSGSTMYSVSEGGKVYLEWNNPGKSCFRLDAGKQYAFRLRDKGSFRMTKIADSETLSAVLLTGQKVRIPSIDSGTTVNQPVSYNLCIETVSSDQPSVIRESGIGSDGEKGIAALSAGSATVTVQFENGFIRYYQITVYSGADVVKTPPAVRTISEETFAGDTSVQFADLSNVKYVGSGAFRGSGLRQIVLNEYDAQCAPDAFAGTHPVFLTRGGSGVDAFACRNGFTVFWFPD